MNLFKLMDFAFYSAVFVFVVLAVMPFKMIALQIIPIAVAVMFACGITKLVEAFKKD